MTHTLGPWTADNKGQPTYTISAGLNAIAQSGGVRFDNNEGLSNARLIAAAPELLTALRNITECAEAGSDGANMDLWIDQARAAIAKAEGK